MDETRDYVYSTWDDNKLRAYLEDKGVITSRQKTTRDQLLAYMSDAYVAVANPVWEAWSESYMVSSTPLTTLTLTAHSVSQHEWLVHHGLIKSDFQKNREALRKQMQHYYYDVNGSVWSTWSESDLRSWLVKHNVIKDDAKLSVDKMRKLVADNYSSATDSIYAGWKESEMRTWLIEHGYMRSDAQVKRDELVKLFNDK